MPGNTCTQLRVCGQPPTITFHEGWQQTFLSDAYLQQSAQLREPSTWPHNFSLWRPLILSSRGILEDDTATIYLPRPYVRILHAATTSGVATGRIYDEEDLVAGFPCSQLPLSPTSQSGELALFLRLDPCSTKDSVDYEVPISSEIDIILRLVTSVRARKTFEAYLSSMGDGIPLPTNQLGLPVHLLPWDNRMKSSRELRCFVAPATDGTIATSRVTAISQYSSSTPYLSDSDAELCSGAEQQVRDLLSRLVPQIQQLHQRILTFACYNASTFMHMSEQPGTSVLECLLVNGFTFDIWQVDDHGDAIELIELNSYGVKSRCGACLFDWVKDFDLLYGVCHDASHDDTTQEEPVIVRLLWRQLPS